ncbi:MAG TPA: EAL domain-containing protein [Sulfuricurvum sp.]|nr:EAL domain-containing protein [Sulfuricurvum sp.]
MNKIRMRAMLLSMSVVLLLILFFVYSILQDKKRVLDEKTSSHRELLKNAYELAVNDTENGLNYLAYKMMTDRHIIDAFESGNREKLYQLSLPYFTEAKVRGEVDLAGFISADGTHFLRLQQPKKFGDNITKKRPMIAEAIRIKKPILSLDVTLFNISLVRIVPVFKDKKFLGLLQVSADISRVQNRLNAHSGIKSAIAINTDTIKNLLPDSAHKQYGDYSIISSNNALFDHLPQDYRFSDSMRHTVDNSTYIIASRELKTYSDKSLARLVCALDITKDEITYENEINKVLLISTLLLILLTIILHIGFKTLIQRINLRSARLNEQLRQQLYTDSLTQLPNRKALIETILKQGNSAILLVNIDNFKEINDLYGHEIGDKILQAVSESIQKVSVRHRLSLYKMPSDEYALLVNDDLNTETFDELCQTVLTALTNTYYHIDGIEIFITVGIGADFCFNTESDLIGRADMALKTAKKQGVPFLKYNESLRIREEYLNNILWSKKLKDAIDTNRFTLYYQGIHDVHTKELYEYEALIRIVDTDGSIVSPYYFLEIAKKTRLYPHITKFVVRTIFEQLKTTPHRFSINLAISDLLDTEIQTMIYDLLKESTGGDRLIFEILESEGFENHTAISAFINHVKTYGCRVAIDDFGTGYSNFAHILRLNVDFIKIDASLIKNLNVDLSAQDIVGTIVEFAHRLNIKTVAEFVHSEDVYNECLELGIDYIQGFYLSEPIPL